MYLLILLLPLFGAALAGFGGFYIGRQGGAAVTIFSLALATVLAFYIFYEVALGGSVTSVKLFSWLTISGYSIRFGLLFDALTSVMLVIITFISLCVHLYSLNYMEKDPHLSRFLAYLSLFTFFMVLLVTADNFLQMFLGWEGVGLCSYLLINF